MLITTKLDSYEIYTYALLPKSEEASRLRHHVKANAGYYINDNGFIS